jgi:ABC-type amino acid transport substrate-binding protein
LGGFTVPDEWRKRIDSGQVTLKENSKLDQLLRQVSLGRVDGAYVSVSAALYEAENTLHERSAFAFDPGLPYQKGSYLASSVAHPEVIQNFNRWLDLHRDQVKAIRAKWKADVEMTN